MRVGVYLGRHAGAGGGIGVYSTALAEFLPKLLQDAVPTPHQLVLYGDRSILNEELVLRIVSHNPEIRLLPNRFPRAVESLLDQFRLPRMLKRDKVAFLHSSSNIGILRAPMLQAVTVHDLFQGWPPEDSESPPPALRSKLIASVYRFFFRRQARRVQYFITDCGEVGEELTKRLNVQPERISTIPLGVSVELLEARKLIDVMPALDPIEACGRDFVLMFASLDPRKNLRRSIAAWQLLPAERRAQRLVLAGADARIRSLVLSWLKPDEIPYVSFLPWMSVHSLVQLYDRAKVILVPTLGEGFGFPVMEAITFGKAVVCGEVPHLKSLAKRHPGVCCCNAFSAAAIATSLLSAFDLRFVDAMSARPRTLEHAVVETAQRYFRLAEKHAQQSKRLVRVRKRRNSRSTRVEGGEK